jgi:hypothetical protein
MKEGAAQCPAPQQPRDRRWIAIAVAQGLLRGIGYTLIIHIESHWHLLDQLISAIQGHS